jgi:hypothetical protein
MARPEAWSEDSRRFAFAVVDRDVYVVDAESGALVVEGEGPRGGATHEIRSLSFNATGTVLTVEVCDRQSRVCFELHETLDGTAAADGMGLRRKPPRGRG